MRKKRNKKTRSALARLEILLALLVSVLLIGIGVVFVKLDFNHGKPRSGEFVSGRADSVAAYRNLDLAVAATANYTGYAVNDSKDLGVISGVDERIFHFSVSKDRLTESGLLTLPTAAPPKNGYPVLILCHGYANPLYYSTEKAYLGDMEFYSRNGFAVFKPDFRGQGLSISAGRATGAYYSMDYNTDVLSLIADIKQTKGFNKDDINLWGHSMGAYVALRASVLSPDIKRTILLSGPVGTVQDMFTSYVAISDTNNAAAAAVRAAQLQAHGTPVTDPVYWDKTSPLTYLADSQSFYQIHVGTDDKIVPPKFSADLDRALTNLHKSHEYFVYPGGNHSLGSERPQIYSRSLARLDG